MTNFEDTFKELLAAYLRSMGKDVARVVGYEQEGRSDGYCETCYYEYTVVEIDYKDSAGNYQAWDYYGDMGELIRELARLDEEGE